ncbi:CPBP family intramembrane glutamic endopeptidase [Amycolatopsis sp. 195334CR]|uniref:CPBP family intramembrane glutamic endopeptidase n=1 Tax=Amycolatopsis sp. 195334CR TaxID=2814588 RepID=UPI001A8D36BB|nr:type II CAAX endopeptidase family protein [Amycolatopsis sp. 195334CR]MBN6035220.1 CPBP family intramembrane metalloprotease [Amycolatopsis sp. 195334CR]
MSYHLQTRGPAYRWWRPLLGAAVLVAVGFALLATFSAVTAAISQSTDQRWEMVLSFGAIAVTLPAVFAAARFGEARKPGTLSSVDGRLRWRWLTECTGWAVAAFALAAAVDLALGARWDGFPGLSTYLSIVALTLLLVPFQAAAEEYVFRGWLVQAFGAWFRTPWPGAVLSSAAFVATHGYTSAPILAELFVFAMILCWLTVRTGGLEAAIGLHAVNNIATMVLAGGAPIPDQSTVTATWGDAVLIAAPSILYAGIADLRYRKRTARPAPVPPPG